MPFTSSRQAAYLAIHSPDIFKRWKKKYGLPEGYSDFLKNARKKKKGVRVSENTIGQYLIETKIQAMKSHRSIHKNYSSEDKSYYGRIHRRVVGAMKTFGLSHVAYEGNSLDESLTEAQKTSSKWRKSKQV